MKSKGWSELHAADMLTTGSWTIKHGWWRVVTSVHRTLYSGPHSTTTGPQLYVVFVQQFW